VKFVEARAEAARRQRQRQFDLEWKIPVNDLRCDAISSVEPIGRSIAGTPEIRWAYWPRKII
jgi:hypothetical protein